MDILSLSIIIGVIIAGFGFLYWTIKNGQNGGSVDSDLKDKVAVIKDIVKSIDDSKIETKDEIVNKLNKQLQEIQQKFSDQDKAIGDNFVDQGKKIHTDLEKIIEQATKIGNTKESVENLNNKIENFQEMLTVKNKRGAFGEFQLYSLLELVFSNNDKIWKRQYWYKVKNHDKQVDAMIFNPGLKNIPIDSKFPWENFRKMLDKNISSYEKKECEKRFVSDLKKKIDEVSLYIDPKTTTNYSIMFIPVESIYGYIIEEKYEEILTYAQKKNVVVVSPITLWPILQNIKSTQEIIRHNKNAEKVKEDIGKLSVEFKRLDERWITLQNRINQLNNAEEEVNKTVVKLTKNFARIKHARGYELDDEEQKDGD